MERARGFLQTTSLANSSDPRVGEAGSESLHPAGRANAAKRAARPGLCSPPHIALQYANIDAKPRGDSAGRAEAIDVLTLDPSVDVQLRRHQ